MKKSLINSVLAVVALTTMGLSNAEAVVKKLECTSGMGYEKFSALLDFSAFTAGSGYFQVKKPTFIDNYLTIQNLTCAGHDLKSLSCVGHPFGISEYITEIRLEEKSGKFQLEGLNVLKGDGSLALDTIHNGPWPCTVK